MAPRVPVVTVLVHDLAMINGFFIDCLISDNHTFDAEITEFPVESGATISDNIRNKPLVVVMDCLVSNSPIGQLVTLRRTGGGSDGNDPSRSAYNMLLKIREDREPVTIFTSLTSFDNMALQNLSIPRESGRGDELRFTATFKQIELVANKREKRVAIVGAKSGGTATTSPGTFLTDGTVFLYVNTKTFLWYDFVICDWRQLWKWSNGVNDAGKKFYILSHGRPQSLKPKEWAHRNATRRSDRVVREDLIALNGGHERKFTYTAETIRDIILISPAEYVFANSLRDLGPTGPSSPGTD